MEERGKITIMSIYNSGKWEKMEERIQERIGAKENDDIIVGGDFNIRTRNLGGIEWEEGGRERRSKDVTIGNEGWKLIDRIQSKGWYILNGTTEGDWEGEYTYVGARGSTVIDYVFVNENMYDRIQKFKIGDRVDSDHMPMEVMLDRDAVTRKQEEEGEDFGQGEEKTELE